jgi:hypothetical protein
VAAGPECRDLGPDLLDGAGLPLSVCSQVGDYSLTIGGGTLVVDAEGDGLASNGTASMSGGTVVVAGPTNSGDFTIDR